MPPAMQAHMPAIEIALGETFRDASHAVAACAHFRLRVAIGRRSIALAVVSSITACSESIAGRPDNAQDKNVGPGVQPRAYLVSANGAVSLQALGQRPRIREMKKRQ